MADRDGDGRDVEGEDPARGLDASGLADTARDTAESEEVVEPDPGAAGDLDPRDAGVELVEVPADVELVAGHGASPTRCWWRTWRTSAAAASSAAVMGRSSRSAGSPG